MIKKNIKSAKPTTQIKVMTWNLGRTRRTHDLLWAYIRDVIKPDIALLQEAFYPVLYLDETLEFELCTAHQKWGTAIYTKGLPLQRIPLRGYSEWAGRVV